MQGNTEKALVSMIVPVYKVEKELARCVESLLQQDYNNYEIILVDDGSPDRSGEIADQLAEQNPQRIRVIHQENRGLSGARNTGIRAAKGQYLSFIDSDDFIEPNMISLMVSELERTASNIAVCGRFDDYPDHSSESFTMDEVTVLSDEEAVKRILTWNQMDLSACDKLFKAGLWEDVTFPEGENNEDIRTVPKVIQKAGRLVHVAVPLYHYCHRAGSITTNYNTKKVQDFYRAIQYMDAFVDAYYPQIHTERVFYLNQSYFYLIMICNRINDHSAERKVAEAYLRKNGRQQLFWKKLTKKERIVCALMRCGLYDAFRKIRVGLKRMK